MTHLATRRPLIVAMFAVLVLAAAIPLPGCRQILKSAARGAAATARNSGPKTDWDKNDAQIVAAAERARANLSFFISRLGRPQKGDEAFAVYLSVTKHGTTEHFWVQDVDYANGTFSGTVVEDGEILKSIHTGDRLSGTKRDVTDWAFINDGKLAGGETIRIYRSRLSPEERKEFDKELEYKIDD